MQVSVAIDGVLISNVGSHCICDILDAFEILSCASNVCQEHLKGVEFELKRMSLQLFGASCMSFKDRKLPRVEVSLILSLYDVILQKDDSL